LRPETLLRKSSLDPGNRQMMQTLVTFFKSPASWDLVCLATAATVIVQHLMVRARWPRWPATIVLGLLALGVYLGTVHDRFMAQWRADIRGAYHYFLGAKYFKELGYADIYRFTLLADVETGLNRLRNLEQIRSQENYELIPVDEALAYARAKRPQVFTDERWREFKDDWTMLSRRIDPRNWERILTDRGFNPPPFWQVFAHPPTWLIDIHSRVSYNLGRSADFLILVASIVLVAVLAGLDAAFLVFLFIHLAWFYSGSAINTYFQFIWLDAVILTMAFYRAKKMIPAGASLAAGAGVSVFPLVLSGGPIVVWLRDFVRTRKFPAGTTRFLVSFAVFSAVFLGIGLAQGQGPSATVDFVKKIQMHAWHQKFDSNKFGLKRTMATDLNDIWGRIGIDQRTTIFVRQRPFYLFLWFTIVGLTVAAMIRGPDKDAWSIPLGMGLIFALMTASRYYYLALIVFLVPGRENRDKSFAALSAALLFLIHASFNTAAARYGDRAGYTAGNFLYLGFFLLLPTYLLVKDAWDRRRARQAAAAQPAEAVTAATPAS
jgi:hypothetical protein